VQAGAEIGEPGREAARGCQTTTRMDRLTAHIALVPPSRRVSWRSR